MSDLVKELTDSEIADATTSGVTLVDFWAPWCGPCQIQGPILEAVAGSIGDKATIAKVNVDENKEKAEELGIMSIPTLVLFKDGAVIQKFEGVTQEADLVSAIENA